MAERRVIPYLFSTVITGPPALRTCAFPAAPSVRSASPATTRAPAATLPRGELSRRTQHRLPTCLARRKHHPEVVAGRRHKVAPRVPKRDLKL